MRVEGVRVEEVQRVVEHRVADPGDLPRGAHRVAEIGRDPARQVQHQRPRRHDRQQHAREHDERDLPAAERGRGRPARGGRAPPRARPAAGGRRRRRRRGRWGIPVRCGAGWGGRCSWPDAVGRHADRRSIRQRPATLRRIGHARSGRPGRGLCVRLARCGFSWSVPAAWAQRSRRSRSAARSSARSCSPTWRSSARPRLPSAWASPTAFSGERVDASNLRELVELIGRVAAGRRPERVRPALQRADLRRLLRVACHVPRHGDDALAPPPRAALRAAGRDAGRLPARP